MIWTINIFRDIDIGRRATSIPSWRIRTAMQTNGLVTAAVLYLAIAK